MPTQVGIAGWEYPWRSEPLPDVWEAVLGTGAPAFLLESVLPQDISAPDTADRISRWTMAGGRPAALLTGKWGPGGFALTLTTFRTPAGDIPPSPVIRTWKGDPFAALRDLQNAYTASPPAADDLPPFCGGLVGYFGYETAHAIERLPGRARDDLQLPDLAFMVADEVVAHDAVSGQVHLIVTGRGPTPAAAAYDVDVRLTDLQRRVRGAVGDVAHPLEGQALSSPGRLEGSGARMAEEPGSRAGRSHGGRRPASLGRQGLSLQGVRATFSKEEYCAAVRKCREAILAGRVFEVCLTQRMEMDLPGSGWALYQALRTINPAPFASYLRLPGCEVAGASPERFLRLGTDRTVESRPIKGTRPRGDTAGEDARLRDELGDSGKDRAENVMIVDLVRSDLGRVCAVGSVRVPRLCAVESYATVHQLVSTVSGTLRPDFDALDLVRACFPGGSMTGAPKIEAMRLIDEIEPRTRGIYSGALGYWDRRGGMDLSIVIRTIVCTGGKALFRGGRSGDRGFGSRGRVPGVPGQGPRACRGGRDARRRGVPGRLIPARACARLRTGGSRPWAL